MSATHPASRGPRRTTVARTSAIATAAADGGKPAGPPKLELKNGTLDWGVKESFRKYVAWPIAVGKITVSDGAKQAGATGRSPSSTARAPMTPGRTPSTPPSRAPSASPATRRSSTSG